MFSSIIIIIDETMITSANGMKTITPPRMEEAQCSSDTSVEPTKNSLRPKLRVGIPTHDPISMVFFFFLYDKNSNLNSHTRIF